jgi:hypothetical protein
MEIINFGRFAPYSGDDGLLRFKNEEGQDWYDIRWSLTEWNPDNGKYLNAIYGAWAMVDPSTMRVTNVEYDPSRLMPGNRIVLGIDADWNTIKPGFLYANGALVDEATPVTSDDVDNEAERRISAGFVFEGVLYQCRDKDRENIAGGKSAATDAITIYGAQPGDLAWQRLLDPTAPELFKWIAADNAEVPMDAYTMMRLGYAALAWKQSHIFAARAVKNMAPIPADFGSNDSYWPHR